MNSAILIHVATVGYAREPEFEVYAPGQETMERRIEYAVRHKKAFRKAVEERRVGVGSDSGPHRSGGGSRSGAGKTGDRVRSRL